jgi:hypothetical protein
MPSMLVYVIFPSALLLSFGNASAETSSPQKLFLSASPSIISAEEQKPSGKLRSQGSRVVVKKKPNPPRAPVIQSAATISSRSSRSVSYFEESHSLDCAAPAEWMIELPAREPTAAPTARTERPAPLPEPLKPILFIWALLLCCR